MIKLIQGDCLDVMKDIHSQSVDLILTDPPYGTLACKWDSIIPLKPMWEQLKRIIKLRGAIVLCGTEPFSSSLRNSNISEYKYDWIWCKENGSNFATVKYQPFRVHELLSVFGNFPTSYTKKGIKNYNPQMTKGEKYHVKRKALAREQMRSGVHKETELENKGERYPISILNFNTVRGGIHRTQKPVPLMEYMINTYTHEGDTVLDFAMGSATTGVGCFNLKRDFIGIELDKLIFEGAQKRISDLTPSASGQCSIF